MLLGLAQIPQCFAGESPVMLADGEYTCRANINAQTLGVSQPNCAGAYIDPSTSDWVCPPEAQPQQSSNGLTMFVIAALIAIVAWKFFAPATASTVKHVAKGDIDDFLPSWFTKARDDK